MVADPSLNPFPGLRPFEADEDHLFFGREKQVDELLRRLRDTRFLAVVGTSGSGKSSLIKCGLIPSLYSGFMAKAGSTWRVSIFRPADDPIGQMAAALSAEDALGRSGDLAQMSRVLVESSLRRGTLGLVEAVREARIPPHENVLVVVDQFEELFRFQRSRELAHPKAEAAAFVKLLLEAAAQEAVPIYVVLTMRSDFLGDCMQYDGLPEAVSAGQYLVPRMTRDELRAAITKPVAVGGGQIASRLVVRLLNDVNDDADQLPVLQHALMRTWDYWISHRQTDEAMDISHYEAIGTMRHALSLHAEEAYAEAGSESRKRIAERMFKALTDRYTDPRGIRRPTATRELAALCEASQTDIVAVIELFRRPGRSFLMPPVPVPIEPQSIIDISHESVMRCWDRLATWAEEERVAAARYLRLARAAAWYEEGTAGLWRDPELEMGLQWRRENHVNAAWAALYDSSFDRAMSFLDRSREERDRLKAERERQAIEREQEGKRKLRQARWGVAILVALLAIAGLLGYLARSSANRAEANLNTAKHAFDEMLRLAGTDSARVAADVPEMEKLRKELADNARAFYVEFTRQHLGNEEYRHQMALAYVRLGDISRILQKIPEAVSEYGSAIAELQALSQEHPKTASYQEAMANAYNWLGESQRTTGSGRAAAIDAYDHAIALQEKLVQGDPANGTYQQELARSHYNRGLARFAERHSSEAEADYRAAIGMLEPLENSAACRQDLARGYNDLAILLKALGKTDESRLYYEKAIAIHDALTQQFPETRDYDLELAAFNQNLGILLQSQNDLTGAALHNQRAIDLYEKLASPAPGLGITLAYAHTLRGRIRESQGNRDGAASEYHEAIDEFTRLELGMDSHDRPDFHLRYGDSLLYLGNLYLDNRTLAITLIKQAISHHLEAGGMAIEKLCYDYNLLTQEYIAAKAFADASDTLSKLSAAIQELPESSRASYRATVERLQKEISQRAVPGNREQRH